MARWEGGRFFSEQRSQDLDGRVIAAPRKVPEPAGLSRVVAASAILVLLTVGLYDVSKGKWSDALIDSGNVWIVPDTLAHGGLLYRDIVYWFGPFTPYAHSLLFRIFGSGFPTLALAGALGAAAVLAALWLALRRVTGRREAAVWTALAIPALIFMPNSGGAILGMGYRMWHAAGFCLGAVAFAVGRTERAASRQLLSGALAGLAGLCRTEWGLAALAAVLIAVSVQERQGRLWPTSLRIVGAFLLVFGGVLGAFVLAAGGSVLRDTPVLLWNLPPEARNHLLRGSSAWRNGLPVALYGAGLWLGAFFTIELCALAGKDRGLARRRLPWLAGVLLLLLTCALVAGAPRSPLFSAAPLLSAAAVFAGLRAARSPRSAALAAFGVLGLLLSHRRFWQISDGPYVAPPLLFALVSVAGLASFAAERREGEARQRLVKGIVAAVVLLTAFAFAARTTGYLADDRIWIRGTGSMLSARPDTAHEIEKLAETIRSQSRPGEGLVVFPEGEVLNQLSARPNPLRHKLYLPGYVTAANEQEILLELKKSFPTVIVIWRRALGEYGAGFFGEDYGRVLRSWIDANYERRPFRGERLTAHPTFEYRVRRAAMGGPGS